MARAQRQPSLKTSDPRFRPQQQFLPPMMQFPTHPMGRVLPMPPPLPYPTNIPFPQHVCPVRSMNFATNEDAKKEEETEEIRSTVMI